MASWSQRLGLSSEAYTREMTHHLLRPPALINGLHLVGVSAGSLIMFLLAHNVQPQSCVVGLCCAAAEKKARVAEGWLGARD
jgi:hypothetical protein